MTTLEIIVHVWAGQLEQYAHLAHYQLSGLFLHSPETCRVTYTVCHCPDEDPLTADLLDAFGEITQVFRDGAPVVRINPHPMDRKRLMRRAIGRDECAQVSIADVVWFGGCDYVYGAGCLDAVVAASVARPANPIYPKEIGIHRTHVIGDAAIDRARQRAPGDLLPLPDDPENFTTMEFSRAIGCLQIVPGKTARIHGYLPNHTKWQKPAAKWQRTHEDPAYRRSTKQVWVPVDIPNLYRLRHTRAGRFAPFLPERTGPKAA